MGRWKGKGRWKIEEDVNIKKKKKKEKKSECQKKIIGKLEIKRIYIYIYMLKSTKMNM